MNCLLKITGHYSASKNYTPSEILVILELPINDALRYHNFIAKNSDLNLFVDFEDLIEAKFEIIDNEEIIKNIKIFFNMTTKYSNTLYDFIKRLKYVIKCVEYKDILKNFSGINNAPLDTTKEFIKRLEDIVENEHTNIISQIILNETEKFLDILYLSRMENKLLRYMNSDLLSLIASYLNIEKYREDLKDIYPNLYKIKNLRPPISDKICVNFYRESLEKGIPLCANLKSSGKQFCEVCGKYANNS